MESGGFSVEVQRTLPVAVVRSHGRVDPYSATELRKTLITALSHQPAGVLVEASELMGSDDAALAVLASVARDSERWSGTPLAVIGGPETVAAVQRLGVERFVLARPDPTAALAALRGWRAPPWRRVRIEANRDAPAAARHAVREFCADEEVGGDGDAAQLVASELVTNAVLHARTAMEFTLRLVAPMLHIAVRDDSTDRPQINRSVDVDAESGRGLVLVDALATAWGSVVLDSGKVVWATVQLRPPPDSRR